MGYALFFARKLELTARVNQMNAQLMAVSNEQFNLTNQISAKQNAANMRMASANAAAAANYASAVSNSTDQNAISTARAAYDSAIAQNSVFGTTSDAEISGLQAKVDALDLSRKTLETQLNAAQNELQSVEKAEESAIKNSTAKYVG